MSAEPETTYEIMDDSKWIVPGLEIDCLYKSPSFAVTSWNCRCGRTGMSDEKVQLDYVISFVHEGVFVLHAEGRSEVVDRTSAVLFNPEAPFRSSHPYGCSDHGSAVVVRREVLLDVMKHYDPTSEERPATLFRNPLGSYLSQAFLRHRLIVQGLTQGFATDPLAVDATLLEVLGAVAKSSSPSRKTRYAAASETSRARRRYVHDAQLILQKRFRERFRLEDVARELYVSTFHLCRLFKEETGIPMHRYVNRLRLLESLEQLTDGAPLTDLALSLGFAGHSHFTTAFRKEFGVPPSEVRRKASTTLVAEMRKSLSS